MIIIMIMMSRHHHLLNRGVLQMMNKVYKNIIYYFLSPNTVSLNVYISDDTI